MAKLLPAMRAFGLFRVLTGLIERSGMSVLLDAATPFTLLAPTDDCFIDLADGRLDAWIDSHNHEAIIALLARHMLPGRYPAEALLMTGWAQTHYGERLPVRQDGGLYVAGVRILQANVRCDNGVLHVVEQVLVPTPTVWRPASPAPDPIAEAPSG